MLRALIYLGGAGTRRHPPPPRRLGLASEQRLDNATQGDKVKPTEHSAKPASTPRIRRSATLRGLRRAQGSGAPARSLVAAPLAALCVLLALSAGVAQAEPPHLISYGLFSTNQTRPNGIAVEGSGDLFVSGLFEGQFNPGKVVKVDPSGAPLSPPSPFGSGYYSGVAVNPVNGDVYVLGEEGGILTPATPAKIFVYDPDTGAPVSSFEVAASRNFAGVFADVQIAADSAGNVYVPVVSENEVLEYSPSGTLLKTFKGSGAGALEEPTGVAVDSSGDIWVADSSNGGRIVELDPSGASVEVNGKPVEIESDGVRSVALDGPGDVFALVDNSADSCGEKESPCLHLVEYNVGGLQLADVGAGYFGEGGGAVEGFDSMVAVNDASGRVYVTTAGGVWVFGPPTAPVVEGELTDETGTSEVKLGAAVDPGGIAASYRFEYGTTTAYGSSTPSPEGSVGEGIVAHAVWAAASGLAPGTTYHYRVVASNELDTVYGPDETFTTLSAEQAACPNEQQRGGFSGRLPDCRAYELVTPPVKNASQFDAEENYVYASRAAVDGEGITLRTTEPQPGASSAGLEYLARRGASGWSVEDIVPLTPYDGVLCNEHQLVDVYSEQLTKEVFEVGEGSGVAANKGDETKEDCNPEGRRVVSDEPVGYENLIVRDNATGAYQLVNVTPPGVTPANARFQAGSADLSHVIFTETSPLAEGGRYGVENLYEWDEGVVRLVSVLPNGTAVTGALAAARPNVGNGIPEGPGLGGVISSDGSHVLFTYGGALYDRIDQQRTVQIDEAQGGSGAGGGGSFKGAVSDGSEVFFLDESKLTPGATAAAGEPDLYECVLPEGASKCELSDLTVAADSEHADVLTVTPLGGHDSSYVYFVAKGVLASNTREFTDSEGKTVVEGAQAGKQNLYLWNGNKTTFIATLSKSDGGVGVVSPDGTQFAFASEKGLTGYDNTQPEGGPVYEGFLYSAVSNQLVCVSCNPSGEPPDRGGAGPGPVTDSGQVFFQTEEALVPSDTNGQLDVYEYEGGHVYLISSGTSLESNLEGASESGDDVFFRSDQQLVPQDDQEGEIVIYDARVGGGFTEPVSPPPCTTADACRAAVPLQPSIYGEPASQTFSGVGNLVAPPEAPEVKPRTKAKTKPVRCKGDRSRRGGKKGKCVKKTAKKAKKSVHANRRGK